MEKEFNDTGTCFPNKHYMVDISKKLEEILTYIEKGKYFVINRPRQYGKTTTLEILKKRIIKNGTIAILISFEGIGDYVFKEERLFCPAFLEILSDKLELIDENGAEIIKKHNINITTFRDLRRAITKIVKELGKKVVLMIDEIDKSSNNDLFVTFLAMLRDKYLSREEELTFHSVILSGLHDIKTLKTRLRPDEEAKYNSPWNIATEFKVDMSFSIDEIETMLLQYVKETGEKMNTRVLSGILYFYTSGYPYFVSKLCKIIDEEIKPQREWQEEDVINAIKILLISKSNANFDTITKNIENNRELYKFVEMLILGNAEISYEPSVPIINFGEINGIFSCSPNNKVKIHNKIYEEKLTNYIVGKIDTERRGLDVVQSSFLKADGKLDMKRVLVKFQEVIEEKYSKSELLKSDEFLENDLRLLFLVYLKPIINGTGFSFKEVQTSEEKRLDIIVIFLNEKFIVELKLWHGEEYHKQGVEQMKGYMLREHCKEGYMIIMSKNKKKEFKNSDENGIFTVWM